MPPKKAKVVDPPAATRSTRGKKDDKEEEKKKDVVTKQVRGKKAASPSPSPPPVKGKKPAAKAAVKKSPSPVAPRKTKSKKKSPSPSPVKKVKAPSPDKGDIKKVVLSGAAPVDEYYPNKDKVTVFQENGIVYDLSMNQTNIMGSNNNNKFYIAQVLTDGSNFYVFFRWGRVGVQGQMCPMGPMSKEKAIAEFNKKKRDKSEKGDYRILERDFTVKDDAAAPGLLAKREAKSFDSSKLPLKVKELVRLIFDMKMINNQMREIGYDAKKMPLGKLAASTIQKGYNVLKQLANVLKDAKTKGAQLAELTSEFYSQIPHDFGMQRPPLIDTDKKVKEKLEMLESIEQIQVATRILDANEKANDDGNIIDNNYAKLGVNVTYLEPDSEKAKLIKQYIQNTHASTHSNYSLEVFDIYELQKDLDDNRFKKDLGNRMLLWHGSRLTNFVGILSQGLRIAPPEAPATGYMFGKGVYFADMVSKSANYCGTSYTNDVGCILLGDVALGKVNPKYYADYNADKLPPGCSSTKGCGKSAPPESSYVPWPGLPEVKVPIGKGEDTKIPMGSLLYNEYIVYDVAQIRLKYLIKLKWNFKK